MPGKPRFFSQISTSIKILFLGLTSLLFISCGGGGGGSVPTPPAPPTNIIATASYANTTCAIKAVSDATKGTLTCWGQMPDLVIVDDLTGKAERTFRVQATPQLMSSDANWIDVTVGRDHICGIKSIDTGNRLYCMGWNYNGQMGLPRLRYQDVGTNTKYNIRNFYSSMVQVGSGSDWKSLSAAYDHTCGIFGVGDLKCWGANRYGVLAQNSLDPNNFNDYWVYDDLDSQDATNKVRRVLSGPSTPANATWLAVDTNDYHTCAIKKDDNTLWCWGWNESDRLGLPASTPAVVNKQFVTAVSAPAGFNPATDAWIKVSTGLWHTCAISTTKDGVNVPVTGKLWCWGDNSTNEAGQKSSGSSIILPESSTVGTSLNWIDVSASRSESCAVNDLNEAYCWGFNASVPFATNTYTLTAVAGRNEKWSTISIGYGHGCGIKEINNSESKLYCWGQQQFSQLGTGFPYNGYIPNRISNDDKLLSDPFVWQKIDTGGNHTCGIKGDNSLWCWGRNYHGRLGIGNDVPSSKIMRVSATNDWVDVASYFDTTCARKNDNTIWCWGKGSDGQLGNGETFRYSSPQQTAGATTENDWDSLSVGKYFSCGRKTDKKLWCWGENWYGQLGIPGSQAAVAGKQQITRTWQSGKIYSGYRGICAIEDGSGDLYCWGQNDYQRIQNNATKSFHLPTKVVVPEVGTKWITAQVGRKYFCAIAGSSSIATEGSLWCWGDNSYGTIGNKAHYDSIDWTSTATINATRFIPVTTPFNVNTPGTPSGTKTLWKQVTAHDENVCAITSDGTLWCWGDNYNGEHGTGNKVKSAAPVQEITKSSNWVMVKNGDNHTCGLQSQAGKTDYSLWCWGGRPFERQIGDLNLVDLQPKLVQ